MLSTRGEYVQGIDHFVLLNLLMNSAIKVGVEMENDDLETNSSGITEEAITRRPLIVSFVDKFWVWVNRGSLSSLKQKSTQAPVHVPVATPTSLLTSLGRMK
jgi:hypothetical protein